MDSRHAPSCPAHPPSAPGRECAACHAAGSVAAAVAEGAATLAVAQPARDGVDALSRLDAVKVPAAAVVIAAGATLMPAIDQQGFVGTTHRSLLTEAPLAVVVAAVAVLGLIAAFALTRRIAAGWAAVAAAAVAAAAHAGAAYRVHATVEAMRASPDYFIAASGASARYDVGLWAGPVISAAAVVAVASGRRVRPRNRLIARPRDARGRAACATG